MSNLSKPCACGQEGRSSLLETVSELERRHREQSEPVGADTPIPLVLASMSKQSPSLWLDLFGEIRCLAEGAEYAIEAHMNGYEARIQEFLYTSAELIAVKAAALHALQERKLFEPTDEGSS